MKRGIIPARLDALERMRPPETAAEQKPPGACARLASRHADLGALMCVRRSTRGYRATWPRSSSRSRSARISARCFDAVDSLTPARFASVRTEMLG